MAERADEHPDRAGAETPDPALIDGLVVLSFLVQDFLSQAAVRHDLSIAQLRLLGVLRDREPGMQELARYLKLDKSSVTGLVDRAERRGLVRRTAHPQDGRAVRVTATPYGQELAARGAAEVARQVAGLVSALPAADRDRLAGLAAAIIRHATGNPVGGADPGHL